MGIPHAAGRCEVRARAADAARRSEVRSTAPTGPAVSREHERDAVSRSSRSSFRRPTRSAAANCSTALPYRLFLDSAAEGRAARTLFLPHGRSGRRGAAAKGAHASASICMRTAPRQRSPGDALDVRPAAPRTARSRARAGPAAVSGWRGRVSRLRLGSRRSSVCLRRGTTISRCRTSCFGIYDWVLAWDHDESRAWLISTGLPETVPRRAAPDAPRRARPPSANAERHAVDRRVAGAIATPGCRCRDGRRPRPPYPV